MIYVGSIEVVCSQPRRAAPRERAGTRSTRTMSVMSAGVMYIPTVPVICLYSRVWQFDLVGHIDRLGVTV